MMCHLKEIGANSITSLVVQTVMQSNDLTSQFNFRN